MASPKVPAGLSKARNWGSPSMLCVYPLAANTFLAAAAMAEMFEWGTVTEPDPPERSTGETKQPAKRKRGMMQKGSEKNFMGSFMKDGA